MLFDEIRIDLYRQAAQGNGTGRRTSVNVPRIQMVQAASEDPVTLAQLKLFMRVDGNDQDTELTPLISAATALCETWTGRAFCARTLKVWYDAVPPESYLELPFAPVSAISSFKYFGDDDVETTWDSSNYIADVIGEPARIVLKNGATWPTSLRPANAVEIQYVVGYGAAGVVPEGIKQAIKLLCVHLYEGKDVQKFSTDFKTIGDAPFGVKMALQPFILADLGD